MQLTGHHEPIIHLQAAEVQLIRLATVCLGKRLDEGPDRLAWIVGGVGVRQRSEAVSRPRKMLR